MNYSQFEDVKEIIPLNFQFQSTAPIVHYRYIDMGGKTVDEYYDNGFKFYKLNKNQKPIFTMIVYVDRNKNVLSCKSMDWIGGEI